MITVLRRRLEELGVGPIPENEESLLSFYFKEMPSTESVWILWRRDGNAGSFFYRPSYKASDAFKAIDGWLRGQVRL